jgi:hypothetical protein
VIGGEEPVAARGQPDRDQRDDRAQDVDGVVPGVGDERPLPMRRPTRNLAPT